MKYLHTFLFGRRYDVPLHEDTSARVLPWIIALMVWLASLSLAATVMVAGLIEQWNADVAGTLTIQVPPAAAATPAETGGPESDPRLGRILAILGDNPAVISAEPVPRQDMNALLAPWLGQGDLAQDLPLPWLVDVEVDRSHPLDLHALQTQLSTAVPGTTAEDHQVWLRDLVVFARTIEVIALLVLALVILAGVSVVIFSTRSGFDIHRNVVEALHMMGATDSYIAGQFQTHAFNVGLRGGLIGLGMAFVTLLIAAWFAARVETAMMPDFAPGWLFFVSLSLMPVASALITMLAARATVMRNLNALI